MRIVPALTIVFAVAMAAVACGDDSSTMNDSDGDGVIDSEDVCPGFDDALDADGDGVPDGCDQCDGDDSIDGDGDGIPDACDPCPEDNPDDTDGDGVCDSDDVCAGEDDSWDTDGDGIPNGCDDCDGDNSIDDDGDGVPDACDVCPLDNPDDSDGDGICDSDDICPGADDLVDADQDGVPDGCDQCPVDNPDDTDGDGVCESDDVCPGFDDSLDADGDGVPDGCDSCFGDNSQDQDLDGVPDACDACPADNPDDTDGDGVCDSDDVCPGFDDTVDSDTDGVADGCDPCPLDNPDDTDGDGVCDSDDVCPGFDDTLDSDGDGVPDGCDGCTGVNSTGDTDDDGICNDIDTDDDNDGVGDATEIANGTDPVDHQSCGDSDNDSCDDCSQLTFPVEVEPNDDIASCNVVGSNDWKVDGEVNGSFDFYCFYAIAGQTITIDIDAQNGDRSPPTTNLDSWLTLQDSSGTLLAQNDDFSGLDSQIVYTIATTGNYVARVSQYPGNDTGQPGAFYNIMISGGNQAANPLADGPDSDGDGICDAGQPQSQDWEGGWNGWTTESGGSAAPWIITTTQSVSPTHSAGSPQAPVDGYNRLISPTFTATNPNLTFEYYRTLDDCGTPTTFAPDGLFVEISVGGAAWTLLTPVGGYPNSIDVGACGNPYQSTPAYTGNYPGWNTATVDLSPYLGQSVRIAFTVGYDCGNCNTGLDNQPVVFIDDVNY